MNHLCLVLYLYRFTNLVLYRYLNPAWTRGAVVMLALTNTLDGQDVMQHLIRDVPKWNWNAKCRLSVTTGSRRGSFTSNSACFTACCMTSDHIGRMRTYMTACMSSSYYQDEQTNTVWTMWWQKARSEYAVRFMVVLPRYSEAGKSPKMHQTWH